MGLWVPPVRVTVLGSGARSRPYTIVCSTSVALPAVSIETRCAPPWIARGRNEMVVEPRVSPETSALHTALAACTAARCWRASPGLDRAARMRSILNGLRVTIESDRALRRICPPPSPIDPSSTSMADILADVPRAGARHRATATRW